MGLFDPKQFRQPLALSGSFTGSLVGTASWASYAVTASYVLNASATIDTGSFAITGSNIFTDKQTIISSAPDIFLIKNVLGNPILTVSQSGILILATQSAELTTEAPVGGMYFTSASFYVGLE